LLYGYSFHHILKVLKSCLEKFHLRFEGVDRNGCVSVWISQNIFPFICLINCLGDGGKGRVLQQKNIWRYESTQYYWWLSRSRTTKTRQSHNDKWKFDSVVLSLLSVRIKEFVRDETQSLPTNRGVGILSLLRTLTQE
jgi:hypothetical protein